MISIQNRRYLGNKYRLLNFIDSTIKKYCPDTNTICDIFAGTGVVGYHFMDRMQIITNDTLYSNYLAHIAFMSSDRINEEKICEIIGKYNKLNPKEIDENYMSMTFSDTYFSYNDCKMIGAIREDLEFLYANEEITEREKAI